jgi:ABC-type transport system involved in multi-copper enzyme maturation permease subunit
MTRTECFKLRTHRTPWVLLGILTASLVVAPIYYAIRPPADGTDVVAAVTAVVSVMAPLLGAVFGGWVIGHEFRQGTLRRVLGSDARRVRLIGTKAGVGLGALGAGLGVALSIGLLSSVLSVASFDGEIVWDGVVRELLGVGVVTLVAVAMAFGLSVVFRSDTYGMLGSLGLMLIVGPLLTLVPKVGKYTPASLTDATSGWVSDFPDQTVSIVPASLGLATYLAVLAMVATTLFRLRDI